MTTIRNGALWLFCNFCLLFVSRKTLDRWGVEELARVKEQKRDAIEIAKAHGFDVDVRIVDMMPCPTCQRGTEVLIEFRGCPGPVICCVCFNHVFEEHRAWLAEQVQHVAQPK